MKTFLLPTIIASLLLPITLLGIEIVIKTDGEKAEEKEEKKEEKGEKKEEEKPKLPEDAVLKINALNQTGFDFALHVLAYVKDETYQGINVQNVSPKKSLKMLAELVAKPDAEFVFDFDNTKMVAIAPMNFHLICEVIESNNEEKGEKKKEDSDEKKDKDSDGKKKEDGDEKKDKSDDKKKDQDGEKKPKIAHKSIDFTFYLPKDQPFPKCVVAFDSFPSIDKEEKKEKE